MLSKIRARRALLTAFLALALPLTLAACGDDTGDDTDVAQEEPTEEETPSEEPTEAETEEPEEEAGLIHVVATEYMFEGVPATLPAGEAAFHFQNDGKEPHEFTLVRKKTDTPTQELLKMPQKKAEKELEFLGGTFAKPGETAAEPFVTQLEAGNYVAVCFVPVKGQGPPHAFEGMVHEFTVE